MANLIFIIPCDRRAEYDQLYTVEALLSAFRFPITVRLVTGASDDFLAGSSSHALVLLREVANGTSQRFHVPFCVATCNDTSLMDNYHDMMFRVGVAVLRRHTHTHTHTHTLNQPSIYTCAHELRYHITRTLVSGRSRRISRHLNARDATHSVAYRPRR